MEIKDVFWYEAIVGDFDEFESKDARRFLIAMLMRQDYPEGWKWQIDKVGEAKLTMTISVQCSNAGGAAVIARWSLAEYATMLTGLLDNWLKLYATLDTFCRTRGCFQHPEAEKA